jgi:serine/threonine-protein kinase
MLGQTLGPYRVLDKLGEGGMGEVYRARDTNLERDVAIKVLPDTWARDADRLTRFRREAQLLASLNHPHIAQVYGIETTEAEPGGAGHTTALVMELVEGPTLADRIAAGPLSVHDALAIARQVAEALDAAHEHGIIHRDLKPANVKVREDGTVKLLDFGLAKAVAPAAGASHGASVFPTITSPAMTAMGIVLGTAAYMSPEQARGRPVDKRTDIWAFGCVLFEMLAGRRPFDGEDVTEVLAAVVKSEPAWSLLPASVPPAPVRLIRRCLEKDSRLRLRDIGDARVDLIDDAAAPAATSVPAPRRSGRERLAWFAALVVVAAVAAAAWWPRPAPAFQGVLTRFPIVLPDGQRFTGGLRHLAVSPDGAVIVYAANGQLYRRALSEPEPQPIKGTDDSPMVPVFSPDGRSIAYGTVSGQNFVIRTIPATGGTSVKVTDLPLASNEGGWTAADASIAWDGNQIIGVGPKGIWTVPASAGVPQALVSLDPAAEVATAPQLLDNGRQVQFTLRRVGETGAEASSIVVQTVGSSTRKILVRAAKFGAILPSGHLVYLRGTDLLALPFEARRLEVTGDPMVIATGVTAQWAISNTGTIAYQISAAVSPRTLVWVDRHGKEDPIAMPPQIGSLIRLSPDGRRLALTGGSEIRVWTFEKSTMTRLSESGVGHWDAVWRGDGRRLLFSSGSSLTAMRIIMKAADGGGAATVLTEGPDGGFPNAVSPDDRFLVFHRGAGELMLQPLDPVGPPRQLVPGIALNAVFSPDGRWIAYQSNEVGGTEIVVRAFPNTGAGRWQVSSGGGRHPLWSPDGRELFFISAAGVLTAVPVESRDGFATGPPVELFRTRPYAADSNSRAFDISHDGKRFVFMKLAAESKPAISVITNWFETTAGKAGGASTAPR